MNMLILKYIPLLLKYDYFILRISVNIQYKYLQNIKMCEIPHALTNFLSAIKKILILL